MRRRFRRLIHAAVIVVSVAGLSGLTSHVARADAVCPTPDPTADTQGCVNQDGNNRASVHEGGTETGGDAVAGSQVIGAAGSGPTTINATNNSQNATSEGGDATSDIHTNIVVGPQSSVTGGSTTVTARTSSSTTQTQTFSPTVDLTLNQFSSPTGEATVSNTASPTTTVNSSQGVTGTATLVQSPTATTSIDATQFDGSPFSFVPTQVTDASDSAITQTANNLQLIDGSANVTNTGSATGTGPVDQTVSQAAPLDISQAAGAPADAVSTNTAAPVIDLTNSQVATATAVPIATATAGTNNVRSDLTQTGDNAQAVFDTANATGGDGVAGSQVIGAAGSGATNITASNTSQFATSEGGEGRIDHTYTGNAGPRVAATGPDVTVTAVATGTAVVTQNYSPTLAFVINQTSTPVARSTTTNSGSPTTSLNAAQSVTGSSALTQTPAATSIVGGPACILPCAAQFNSPPLTAVIGPAFTTVDDTSNSTQEILAPASVTNDGSTTGTGPVSQSITQNGGSANATQSVAGDATGTQSPAATTSVGPAAAFSPVQGNEAGFLVVLDPVGSSVDLTSNNTQLISAPAGVTNSGSATGTSPVTQTINQSATNGISQTGGGASVSSSNTASPVVTATNTQRGSADASPVASATSGDHKLLATLNQNGDNRSDVFHPVDAVAGDGVAGSQVIGVASSGPTTIDATNNSVFADSIGGDSRADFHDAITLGPSLSVAGGPISVTAISTGAATVSQSASPTITLTINQTSSPTGISITTNTATPSTTLNATQAVTGTATLVQSPTATNGVLASQINVDPSLLIGDPIGSSISSTTNNMQIIDGSSAVTNTGSATGTSPVSQTAAQSANTTIDQSGSPVLVTSSNTDSPTINAANVQTASVTSSPVVTAVDTGAADGVSG